MPSVGKGTLWTGRVVSAIPVAMMLMSGAFKLVGAFTGSKQMLDSWTAFGYPPGALLPIGLVEVACAVVYAIPRTAVLGGVLVAGYLGGAIATHVRMSQGIWVAPASLGVLAWLGLWLRDPRLRALLPLRGAPAGDAGDAPARAVRPRPASDTSGA